MQRLSPSAGVGGRTDRREGILAFVRIEPLSERLARTSGEALAAVRGATATDAVVMASAASRGDVVLTSDVDDLECLRRYFPSVRVLGVRGLSILLEAAG